MGAQRTVETSVAELMHTDVVTIDPQASLAELASLLRRHEIHGVPVVDAGGKAVGMVSVSDLLWLSDRVRPTPAAARAQAPWEGLDRVTVRDVMTPDVFGVPPAASVGELLDFFARTGLHRALVLADGRVVGIVTTTDLLELMAQD